ncbi:MAG: hypothetical protein JWN41_845 [Thermoleophilia bacterium]|nr:hypothetical protein [Thermoleophilia bacterium]
MHVFVLACVMCLAMAHVALSGSPPPEKGVSLGNSVASPARIAAAQSIANHQGAISKNEPDQCKGLTASKVESIGGSRSGAPTLAVSPGDIELVDLQPDTDYVACLTILNFGTSGEPISGRLDDVDIKASDDPRGGIDVIDRSKGVGTWVMPATRTFSVPVGSRVHIPYVVHTPSRLPAGTVVGGLEAKFNSAGTVSSAITQRIYVSHGGGVHRQLQLSNVSGPRVLGRRGLHTYRTHFGVHNVSDYVETFEVKVKMSGLGRTVRQTKVTGGALLPDGSLRMAGEVDDMPWIGIFRPTLTLSSRQGPVSHTLPWVVVLPPWPYVVALLLAILIPLFVLLWRWRQRRAEWLMYLDDESGEHDELGDETYADWHRS